MVFIIITVTVTELSSFLNDVTNSNRKEVCMGTTFNTNSNTETSNSVY